MTTAPVLHRIPGALRTMPPAAAHPAITPRLLVPGSEERPLDLAAERALGTYAGSPYGDDPARFLGTLEDAGLRGRGGAAFPAHVKWRGVAAGAGPHVVVANGEEGEPASFKDRWLLTRRPHLVLDGLLLAARTVGADRAVVYLSHPETVTAVRAALAELGDHDPGAAGRVELHTVTPTYVAGEESAVCRSLDGGPALPTAKPPRPFEKGVGGRPTLVSNVETLAHAAWISRHGAAAHRAEGSQESPGTTLVTLTGACGRPGVYEVPFGRTVGELCTEVGGGLADGVRGFLTGGWFGGLLGPEHTATAVCPDALRAAGSGLGCGAITALGPGDDPLRTAADISAWYAQESAAQCGVCIKGTRAIRDTLARLADGAGTPGDLADLTRWGRTLPGRGACSFLDGAATLARSTASLHATAVPPAG